MTNCQRKFNFISNEFRQLDLNRENPNVISLFNEVLIAAEILSLKEIKQLIQDHLDLNWSMYWDT
jgi:hypothetical protein